MQKLCASYGTSLTTLTLDFGSCALPRRQAMDWIFTQCPRLELLECSDHVAPSLIRSAVEKLSSDKRPVHTSLRRIGLLASVEFDFDAMTPELSTAFPALDAIVVHDYYLLTIPDPFTGIENIVLLRHNLHDWIAVARDKGVRLLDSEDRNISIVDDVPGLDVDNIEDDPDYGSGSECSFAYGTDNEGNYVYETDSYDEDYYSEGPDSDSEEDWDGEHMTRELAPEPSNAEQSGVGREEAQRIYTNWLELGADMVDTDSDSDASAA
ncbi:hypothetical protein DFH11DRAFT_1881073 [Phellopilus nigrolimitatus]|nr:hypothetical protein DFH11DRAFT_1881073 [Phellopilus nigrolimitatus]